ncbi:hypothetical protein V6N13_088898 [Hibiscus sabdariffa]|uniref:Uncharacterized protein n=1 Tax=Hibiscus sabdariffa TaxID=183260 RepID=A0ABR2G1G0_9ROSI
MLLFLHSPSPPTQLHSSSPNTLFSSFSTAQSNNSIFSTSQSTPPNIKAYNVDDGVPEGYVFVEKPQEDIELFMIVAPQNFSKGMEMAVEESGRKLSCLVTNAFFWFAKEMALENGYPFILLGLVPSLLMFILIY